MNVTLAGDSTISWADATVIGDPAGRHLPGQPGNSVPLRRGGRSGGKRQGGQSGGQFFVRVFQAAALLVGFSIITVVLRILLLE